MEITSAEVTAAALPEATFGKDLIAGQLAYIKAFHVQSPHAPTNNF